MPSQALALLAKACGLLAFWSTLTAARLAERKVVAAQMLNHCFEFGANKQRLKVWFAQSALAADAFEQDKKILLDNIPASPAALQLLALNDAANSSNRQNEFNPGLDSKNFAMLKLSVLAGNFQSFMLNQPTAWSGFIHFFDRSTGATDRITGLRCGADH